MSILAMFMTGCDRSGNQPENSSVEVPIATEVAQDNNSTFVWPEASPGELGADGELLLQMEEEVTENYPAINSLLIVKNGNIVYEKYFNNATKDTPVPVYSVTKSVMSALTGIAIEQGYFMGTDQKLSEFLPAIKEQEDKRKQEITIRHALTMTGGLERVDDNYYAWYYTSDWVASAVGLPLTDEPGAVFEYNTGLPHLLSGALTEASGMSTKEFADKYLFGPLEITNYNWDHDSTGVYNGGNTLFLLPRDMAKFGYLYLNKGKWGDRQIVPGDWVEASTRKQVSAYDGGEYGYLFWIMNVSDSQGNLLSAYEANGYLGQHIRVIPELDTVVVVTSSQDSNVHGLVESYIVPALE
ncbi:serine hydrolase [Paenibacillus sp. M1]|uniref:Serine hydrolase n=1 Tax=Paenibacillus haidiansis TaxID=1574488 RepID=A0ABU7VSR7_9BACL